VSRAIDTYPGIQALEWAPEIAQRDRDDYEQQLKTFTQNPQALITERDRTTGQLIPARERDRYVPVTFLEPVASNEVALGYDLASDDTRRVALEIARDTGMIAATGRIQLVQETNEDQYGFLVFVPIYEAITATLPERRAAIEGYVLGVFEWLMWSKNRCVTWTTTLIFTSLIRRRPPGINCWGFTKRQRRASAPTPGRSRL
jgi:CHASE1-domain containing sensor protein